MNKLHEQIKRRYISGLSKIYYAQDPERPRRRNTIRCTKCHKCFGWYDRLDFDSYNDIPSACLKCAASEPWWDADPYFEIWND